MALRACTPQASLAPLAVRHSKSWELASQGCAWHEQQPSLGARLCTPRGPLPLMLRGGSGRRRSRQSSSGTSSVSIVIPSAIIGGRGGPLHTLRCAWHPVRDIRSNAIYMIVPFDYAYGRTACEAYGPTSWAFTPGLHAWAQPFMAGARLFARLTTNRHGLSIMLQCKVAHVSNGSALGAA